MKACSNVSMCGVRLRPWPEPVEVLYFACVGMPRNKKSRGEWDETQNLEVCLLLALLLTACGGQNREPENPPAAKPSAPGEEAAETSR